MERCQEYRPGGAGFRGSVESEVFVSTRKVQKMRQIMTAWTGMCSKQGDYDEYYFFQHKFKKTVFSYETALYLQGLTDKIPQLIEASVPYSYKINNLPNNVKLYYVKSDISDMGAIEVKTIYQNKVRAYNIERIICDFVQNKNNIDPEVYVKTIRGYASSKNSDINKLFIYAKKMGIIEKVRTTMEVIYE